MLWVIFGPPLHLHGLVELLQLQGFNVAYLEQR